MSHSPHPRGFIRRVFRSAAWGRASTATASTGGAGRTDDDAARCRGAAATKRRPRTVVEVRMKRPGRHAGQDPRPPGRRRTRERRRKERRRRQHGDAPTLHVRRGHQVLRDPEKSRGEETAAQDVAHRCRNQRIALSAVWWSTSKCRAIALTRTPRACIASASQALDPLLLDVILGPELAREWVPRLERYYADARRESPASFLDFARGTCSLFQRMQVG